MLQPETPSSFEFIRQQVSEFQAKNIASSVATISRSFSGNATSKWVDWLAEL